MKSKSQNSEIDLASCKDCENFFDLSGWFFSLPTHMNTQNIMVQEKSQASQRSGNSKTVPGDVVILS